MALIVNDRVKETSTTTGTGTIEVLLEHDKVMKVSLQELVRLIQLSMQ